MKKLTTILVALSGLLCGGPVQSQTNNAAPPGGQPGWRSESADERFNRLSQELNLTEEQKAKVRATFDETRQKIQAAVEEARSNAEAQLQSVLTPDQYQKLQNLWQQHGHHGNGSNTNATQ